MKIGHLVLHVEKCANRYLEAEVSWEGAFTPNALPPLDLLEYLHVISEILCLVLNLEGPTSQ